MRSCRRHSGDGSVKVVLSGDSNSPPKTTPRREPPSYNLPPTQEVRTCIPFVAADVSRLIYPADDVAPFSGRQEETRSFNKPAAPSSFDLLDLGVVLVNFPVPRSSDSSKKPVFALIRGLCDSQAAREFSTIVFLLFPTTDHGQLTNRKM
jgi:hypothetical protein